METNSINQKFTPLSLIRFAFPSIIMMIFLSCYTIVDGVFISRFIGSDGLSGSNIVYPVINIIMAVGIMLATGASAIVAKELGEGKEKAALEHFTFITVISVIASIIIMVIALLFTDQISIALGADQKLLPYCRIYLQNVIYFAPACMLQAIFQSFFVTAGKPNLGLFLIILAGIVNAVLDYLFMGVWKSGIEGAAIATGIGQMIPAVFGLLYFSISKKGIRFTRFKWDMKALAKACFNGSSEMVTNLSNAVISFALNIIMMRLIGPDGVAAITIMLYAQFFFNSFYMGFSLGVAPIFSFQFGAKDQEKLHITYKISTWFIILSSCIVLFASFFLSKFVVSIFVAPDNAVYHITLAGFSIFAFSFLFSGFNIFSSSLFTALSDGKTSAILSFARTFVLNLIMLLVLPNIFGINGVWMAIPLAEFFTMFLSFFYHKKSLPIENKHKSEKILA